MLLKEELRRVQVSFEKEAALRSPAPMPAELLNANSRVIRGYMAYMAKQADAYTRLAQDAFLERKKVNLV